MKRTAKFRIYAEKNITQAKKKKKGNTVDSAEIDNHNKLEVSIAMVRLFSPNPQQPHRDSKGW